MPLNVSYSSSPLNRINADLVAYFVPSDEALFKKHSAALTALFPQAAAALASPDFKAKKESSVLVYLGESAPASRLLVVGLGEMSSVTSEVLRRVAAVAGKVASGKKLTNIALALPEITTISASALGEALTEGVRLTAYKFTKYFSGADAPKGNTVASLTFALPAASGQKSSAEKSFADALDALKVGVNYALAVADGVLLARDLANAPNNEIYPETLAKAAQKAAREAGFTIEVFGKTKIEAMKMHGLLAVNQGSVRPPVFLVMKYMNAAKTNKSAEAPIVLVGKGVTFDTGGISIKPAAGMGEMKSDMHGAASVIGTMYAIAKLGLKVNVIGLVPSTENMPSGTAVVPGDVITYSNGMSAEVDNTDAEGRLILADALIYAQRYAPQAVIDLATLTGACVVALGGVTSGLFGNDAALKERLKAAGDATNEYVCELPLYPEYEDLIKSDIADVKNTGGRWAGAITAALFLKRFIKLDSKSSGKSPSTSVGKSTGKSTGKNASTNSKKASTNAPSTLAAKSVAASAATNEMPWAHLDIAGPAILSSDTPYMPKGGSGVGVRLLCSALRSWNS
jgi:leucyl aminopeptidase